MSSSPRSSPDLPHKLDELGDALRRPNARATTTTSTMLLARGGVDAVYIAVPNDLHAEMTLIAARHGVHVLCEKPMAPTEAECMQMIRACEQRRRQADDRLPAALPVREPRRVEIARGGELGEPRVFSSTFSMQVRDGNIARPGRAAAPARCTTSASTASTPRATCSAPSRSRSMAMQALRAAIRGSPPSTRRTRSRCASPTSASPSSRAASARPIAPLRGDRHRAAC